MLGCTCAREGNTCSLSREQQLCCLSRGTACSPQGAKAGVRALTLSKQLPVALALVSDACQHPPSARHLGQRELWWRSRSPVPSPVCGEGPLQHPGSRWPGVASDGQERRTLFGHAGRQVPAQARPVGQVRRGQQDAGQPVPVGRGMRPQQKAEVSALLSSAEPSQGYEPMSLSCHDGPALQLGLSWQRGTG